jgi:hypothetical protein
MYSAAMIVVVKNPHIEVISIHEPHRSTLSITNFSRGFYQAIAW